MSSDARLIAAAILCTRQDVWSPKDGAETVAVLEKLLPDTFTVQEFSPKAHQSLVTKEPGIRGMVPVALVRDWLRDIHVKMLGAEAGRETLAVESILQKYYGELNQFSGDA